MANGSGLEHETCIELSAILYDIYNRLVLNGTIRIDPATERRKDIHIHSKTYHTWSGTITAAGAADWNQLQNDLAAAPARARALAAGRGNPGAVVILRYRLECPPLLDIVSVPPPSVYWT